MKHFTRKIALLVATIMMAALFAVPLSADFSYTGIAGPADGLQLTKYIVMDIDATVPAVTFSFTAEAGTADTSGSIPVYAGDDGSRTTGLPMASVTFSSNSPTSSAALDAVGFDTASTTQKYAYETFHVDFSNVTFNEPGIYRYTLTEDASTAPGIVNDTNAVRTIDVYVENNTATNPVSLTVADIRIYNGSTITEAAKMPYYVNSFTTYDLTVSKTVTGNQGSRDEYFPITVTIDGPSGTSYVVDRSNANETTPTTGANTSTHENPATIAAGTSTIFWLQNGQSIVVNAIGEATAYTVSENFAAVTAEGYTISATCTDTDATNNAANDGSIVDNSTGITADTTIAFTNTKEGAIPTGVLVNATPIIVVGIIVFAGIVALVIVKSRRKAVEAAEAEAEEA